MAGYPKVNGFFSVCRYFRITCCSEGRVTTIDFKELLYLMPVFSFCFALITFFKVYNNICSVV